MSKAKFAAAKEMIEEGNYDEARAILRKIDHPTAEKWLNKLDQIDPPFPTQAVAMPETEKYYKRKNRKIRMDDSIERLRMIGAGIFLLVLAVYMYQPSAEQQNTMINFDTGWVSAFAAFVGVIALLFGILDIRRKR